MGLDVEPDGVGEEGMKAIVKSRRYYKNPENPVSLTGIGNARPQGLQVPLVLADHLARALQPSTFDNALSNVNGKNPYCTKSLLLLLK